MVVARRGRKISLLPPKSQTALENFAPTLMMREIQIISKIVNFLKAHQRSQIVISQRN